MARLRGGPLRRYSYTAAVEPDIANDWVGNEHPHPSNSKQLTCFSTGGGRVSGGETWAPSARSDTTIKEKQMELNASTPTGFITTEVGLSDGTPIPTPEGWTLLGDIARGDRVFDPRGRICAVTEVDRQGVVPVHEVRFDDGARRCSPEGAKNGSRSLRGTVSGCATALGTVSGCATALGTWASGPRRSSSGPPPTTSGAA